MRTPIRLAFGLALAVLTAGVAAQSSAPAPGTTEGARARRFARAVDPAHPVPPAWLKNAHPATLLMPDYPAVDRGKLIYTPHNSGADLYPYLILTAQLTDRDLYDGRLMEMLRKEVAP